MAPGLAVARGVSVATVVRIRIRSGGDGEAMARIMSLVFMVFMVVPVLAPSVGQLILLFAPWRAIFLVLAAYGLAMLVWSWLRLPETLHPEYRRSLRLGEIGSGIRDTLSERQSLGYTMALAVVFGGLTAYIASVQQIVFDVFESPEAIGLVFAAVASAARGVPVTHIRLCGEARPGQILLSRRALVTVEDLVETEFVGELTLKGFSRPISTFDLVKLRTPRPTP